MTHSPNRHREPGGPRTGLSFPSLSPLRERMVKYAADSKRVKPDLVPLSPPRERG
jgi:hypothetical protein